METIRWGFLGCGNITSKFAEGLQAIPDAKAVALASRRPEEGRAFAEQYGVPTVYDSYEALAADSNVDVIYMAGPHVYHRDNAIMCLERGKAVLCEKPMSLNAGMVDEMIAAAKANGAFLMEAMWTRFLPTMVKVRELLASGAIGQVRMTQADFGFRCGGEPNSRLMDRQLGGGGLLDVGVYSVAFTSMVYGGQRPASVVSQADVGETGVDEQAAWVLGYDQGRLGIGWAAVRTNTRQEATILGTDGWIRVESPFWRGNRMSVCANGKTETLDLDTVGNGYNYQAVEVGECLRQGKLECPTMPLAESRQIAETMDRIRAPWGVTYPGE